MSIQEYIENMQTIQQNILDFLEDQLNEEEKYQDLIKCLSEKQISINQHDLKTFLYILVKISNNHFRCPHFFEKIEKILLQYKNDIKKNYSNIEIFKIFKNNKRILLFLFQEGILIFDEIISSIILKDKYAKREYFNYLFYENYLKFGYIQNLDEKFYENRKNGENEDIICQIIREDNIEKFIIYVNKNDYSLNSLIKPSIFETNLFLLKRNETSLIEYAAFFGSTQIFKYLYKNDIELTSSLWLYAIHGNDPEIISILEENSVTPPLSSYIFCIRESIICHHNNIVNYIQSNHYEYDNTDFKIIFYGLHYHNFLYIQKNEIDNVFIFQYACQFDYFKIVEYFIINKNIDLNMKIPYKILKKNIFSNNVFNQKF